MSAPLPVDAVLDEVCRALERSGRAVLQAPTGAGKTTRVPPALLDAGLGPVLVLEPRRVAARAAAARMAAERGVPLGGEVGYRVRFERKVSADTRLEVVTTGLFVRRLLSDPLLEGVGTVVLDEAHERSLDADLAFALLQRVRAELRPDLKLLVMSATLDAEAFAEALDDAPVLSSEGRLFPVDVAWLPRADDGPLIARCVRGIQHALTATAGDVLVFLPGVGEIRGTAERLAERWLAADLDVLPLHGELSAGEQDAALRAGPRRRVVLATNVAETSVTVEGVSAVVDTGVARVLRHDPAVGLDRLELQPIARAAAEQRAGRAGRLGPGLCVRLWTSAEHDNRPAQETPELARVDLAGTVLALLDWGERDPRALPWLQAPPEASVSRALELLQGLGAVADGRPTSLGRRLARLPVHPRLGRLLLAGAEAGVAREAALAAACLSERDVFPRRREAEASGRSDVLVRVRALREGGRGAGLHRGAAARVRRVADELRRHVRDAEASRALSGGAADEALLEVLFRAFPDRLARRREPGGARAVMVGGRGVQLEASSVVRDAELFVCVELQGAGADARVRQASAVERAWLDAERLELADELSFDPGRGVVQAVRRERYDGLVLAEASVPTDDPAAVAEVLAEAAAADMSRVLPDDRELADLRARLACLAAWSPELGLPGQGDDADVRAVLPDLCMGRRGFAELRRADWCGALRARLDHRQRAALERDAPERLAVPSGSKVRIVYEPGRPPVLAVRIQEMFGLAETPRVGAGKVPVLLHLLAPNGRAQQVTDDLAGFWARTYPTVRKELRARYPRHAWPEEPASATAERRPRRRRS